MNTEEAIRSTASIYQMRDYAKVIFGTRYEACLNDAKELVQSVMDVKKINAVEAAMVVAEEGNRDPRVTAIAFAAAAEIVEPST